MSSDPEPRRQFLKQSLAVAGALAGSPIAFGRQNDRADLFLTCQEFSWRSHKGYDEFFANLNENLAEIANAGFDGFGPSVWPRHLDGAYIERLIPLLPRHNLEMRSIIVYCNLYDRAKDHADRARRIAATCQENAGTRIVVVNPLPLREPGECKTDDQLKYQGEQLDKLGAELAAMGLKAAYHSQEQDFTCAAREFHHMFAATDPEHLSFCLDADRIYRGTGNSQLALLDIINLYGSRVSEIHFRQSDNGVWTESFGAGDLDYSVICRALADQNVSPHFVYEQACSNETPRTLTALAAHGRGREYLHNLCSTTFGVLAAHSASYWCLV